MPVVLPNVIFDVFRPLWTAKGNTSAPMPHLAGIEGNITLRSTKHLVAGTTAAVRMGYAIVVEIETDILVGDVLVNFLLKKTGQPWIDDQGIVSWKVIEAADVCPGGVISYRSIVVQRIIGGGPAPV